MIAISISLIGCSSEKTKNSSIITEVYEVKSGADDDYAKGALKYMEHENFEGDRMVDKTFYNSDQTIRGKEIYQYNGNSKYPSGSKYYDKAGALMSTYKFEYQDSLKVRSEGYEGDSEELLRIEGFQYDNKGNMVSKTIYNSFSQKQKTFLFGHDTNGNEVKMVLLNEEDKQVLSEAYEIVTISDDGEWLEKWGYLNDSKAPVTFYHKRKSEI